MLLALILAVLLAWPAVAFAQPQKHHRDRATPKRQKHRPQTAQPEGHDQKSGQKSGPDQKGPPPKDKVQEVDFTGLDIAGRLHTPQLLYFLRRVKEELGRAALERRSFLPALYRSVKEDPL